MNVQSLSSLNPVSTAPSEGQKTIKHSRQESNSGTETVDQAMVDRVQPEELLDKIKELTDNGMYQVRFEMNNDVDKLVISLVDSDSGELVRQIPPEELLVMAEFLKDLRGNLVNSAG